MFLDNRKYKTKPPWHKNPTIDENDRIAWFVHTVLGNGLTRREEDIFYLWLKGNTATEISDNFNVTRSRIRQVFDKAIAKIRFKWFLGVKVSDALVYKPKGHIDE